MKKDIPRHYEGPEVLASLLAAAGCALTLDDVVFEFEASLEEDPDTEPGEILPLLFEDEPRFGSAEEARRTYGNLLGLWDQLRARALGQLPVLAAPSPAPPAEGAAEGPEVPAAYVAFVWRELTEGGLKVQRRAEDRFENRQGVALDWLRSALEQAPPEAEEVAVGLAVAAHEAFLRAFGEAGVPTLSWQALDAAAAQEGEEPQPALAALHEDVLDEAAESPEAPLPAEGRAPAARALAALRRALTRR